MPRPHLRLRPSDATVPQAVVAALEARFDAIRAELEVPAAFPPDVLAEATEAAAGTPELPALLDVPFFTLDPVGSMDLDQAMHLAREGEGYRVRYAIADVPHFVRLGGPLDAETRSRGTTIYAPDERTPLHPPVLSEGAASLLPGQERPAYVWDLRLDAAGSVVEVHVARALVRSVERLDYEGVQAAVDAGTNDERLLLLREIGEKRMALETARGGASLPMPEQETVQDPATGAFHLTFRPTRASEEWNAQISLMTGMAAADLMIGARVGILRTMPPAEQSALDRFRHEARALGVAWPQGATYADVIRSLDRTDPRHLALIHDATSLFRGAGYTPIVGEVPEQRNHGAVAAPYAHVTAPLRRLVDRFGLLVCENICAGREVPQEVREALPLLPELMAAGDRKAGAVERACADAVEAAVLSDQVGEVFAAVVVDGTGRGPVVQLVDEPIIAVARGSVPVGEAVRVRLEAVDVAAGTVSFAVVPEAASS